jgi:chromosomal replication initiation ATPase DnaA
VAPGNAQAVGLIDAWPDWVAPAAAIHGPPGSGKSHLAAIWLERTGGSLAPVDGLGGIDPAGLAGPMAVEDIDRTEPTLARDRVLFALIEAGQPLLLTGHTPPSSWPVALPDLASRFAALLAFPLWEPDETLLAALARKLFMDRQLSVPDSVIQRMIRSLERSPASIRDFVAMADEKALAENRPVNLSLVRELVMASELEPK